MSTTKQSKHTADFDRMPFVKQPNPLPCGCAIVGALGLNLAGTRTEYRNLHIKFCAKHDPGAVKKLVEAVRHCEWVPKSNDHESWSECPLCFSEREQGHSPGCEMAEALALINNG